MVFKLGVGNIDHVQQQVRFPYFVEGRFKRLDQLSGEFSYKTNGIREQEGQVFNDNFSDGGVEGSKEFVFGKNLGF